MFLVENETMLTLRGTGNLRGSAVGKTKYLHREPECAHSPAGVPRREITRLESATKKSQEEILSLYHDLASQVGEGGAWIFLLQFFILEDKLFSYLPRFYISEGKSASEAVALTLEYFSKRLSGKTSFFAEIALDVRDVAKRLLRNLKGRGDEEECDDSDIILLANDPLPSEIYRRHSRLLGLVSDKNAEHSSTAALVRSLGIPAVYISEPFGDKESNKNAIIDSVLGTLYIDPDIHTVKTFSEGLQSRNIKRSLKNTPLVFAEPENLFDVKHINANEIDGIGPVGSEELYLCHVSPPDEETLYEEYRALAESFVSKPVVIRALASGGSVKINKLLSDENREKIKIYVTEDKTFKNQLRAIMRAAVYGTVLLALPPTLSYLPLSEARRLTAEVAEELQREGREFASVKLGAIIDSYSQLIMGEKLLKLCDFAIVKRKALPKHSEANEIENDATAELLKIFSKNAKTSGKLAILSLDRSPTDSELKDLLRLGFDALSFPSASLFF